MDYNYKDVTAALEAVGYRDIRASGSHHIFSCPKLGLTHPVPRHDRGIAKGTAEEIIQFAVFSAVLQELDLTDKKYKLPKNVLDTVKKQYKEIEKDPINTIPATTRARHKIETRKDALAFLEEMKKRIDKTTGFIMPSERER